MDLGRFINVAWRFRVLLAAGLVLATAVAMFSFLRIGLDGGKPSVEYREQETWLTASTLLVTQKGFPWGRAILDEVVPLEGAESAQGAGQVIPRFGDPGRYSGLAAIYAELVKSDEVRRRAMVDAGPGEYYESSVVMPPGQSTALPMIYVKGYGPTAENAVKMAERASKAFIDYLDDQQAVSGIPNDKRVEVVVTQKASQPELFAKRSMVRPVMLFLLISMVFLAVAFALENLRPSSSELQFGRREEPLEEFDQLWVEEPPRGDDDEPADEREAVSARRLA